MKRDLLRRDFFSSFLSCEKDAETILRRLFVESEPYSDALKRLLIINTKDCLDEDVQEYNDIISRYDLKRLVDEEYVKLQPKIKLPEHEEKKGYILLAFDNFTQSKNPQFRDCTVSFDIICHTDNWDIGDYRQRPLKIAGCIDAILNGCKLSGIGILNFLGCSELILSPDLSGYTLLYEAVHGSDDIIPSKE